MKTNEFGQVIGEAVPGLLRGTSTATSIEGRYTRLEKLNGGRIKKHLYAVYGPDTPAQMWTYLAGKFGCQ